MSECFLKPKALGAYVNIELDLSNYATKPDLKNTTDVDTSKCAKMDDLASLKSNVDKLEKVPTGLNSLKSKVEKIDVDKLVSFPVDLSKPSDVVKTDVVKKTEYDELLKKISTIQTTYTSDLVKKN